MIPEIDARGASPARPAEAPAQAAPADLRNGPAAAAYLSAMIGLLALAVSHVASEISERAKQAIHSLGKLWMPGAEGIGPYSGKETIGLVAWIVSWILLARLLRRRGVPEPAGFIAFLVGLGLATTLLWPPATHVLVKALGAH